MWNRSIQSGYNNYRIDNYMKFKNIYEVNIERSNLIDEEVRNCVESGSDLKAYKNELSSKHTYDFSYIKNEEDRALYERIAKEVIVCHYQNDSLRPYEWGIVLNGKNKEKYIDMKGE